MKRLIVISLICVATSSQLYTAADAQYTQKALNQNLRSAIFDHNVQAVKHWIANGADINNVYDHSYLMIAAEQGSLEIIDLLLEKGADVNIVTYTEENVLHRAIKYSRKPDQAPAIIKRLIKAGVYINIPLESTYSSQTPLYMLVESTVADQGSLCPRTKIDNIYALPIAFQLLVAGADRSIALQGFVVGADGNYSTTKGTTPLMRAHELSNHDMAALLEMYPGRNLQELSVFSIAKMFYSDDPEVREKGEKLLEQLQERGFAILNPYLHRMLYLIIGKEAPTYDAL